MEVTLKAGDSLNIPEGCKMVIKDNVVVFEKEEKEKVQEFNDGDVLCAENGTIVIFKEKDADDSEYFYSHYSTERSCIGCWLISAFRHATEEEKQLLFDKMKEDFLQWDTEEKRVEKVRWKADVGEKYYFINSSLDIIEREECWSVLCNEHYSVSNYFRTEKQALEALKRIKETLKNYHNELGE